MMVLGAFLFTLFAVFTILFIALQKKKQHRYLIEKQEREHRYSRELMQSRLEVQEQTLKNLSAELHDNIAQVLGMAKMQLHVLAESTENEQPNMARETAEMVGEAIKDIRSMSHLMNGAYILKQGLHESIEKDLQRISSALRIKCNFKVSGNPFDLDEDKELILFRVIQECVANAVKHGTPYSIEVSLNYHQGTLSVEIVDDGKGFDPENLSKDHGLGLMNIRERVHLLNGKVDITSELKKGTRIQLNIPQ
ncbi:MAG: sensor histidine kinase [Chitinophagaceae bacterium]|nr:sensor histidine kinase [Chitinophagaceae bacterium]MCB9045286.1 sensor histidine kinase [Chitinophagales bacterium]